MSRFNPNATDKSPEEWSAIALQKSSNTGTQYTTIGGIVLALWVGSSAGLIPGLLVLAWSIYFNFEKAKGSSRNCEAIAEEGCIAHALPERELRAYARQIGQEKILEEIEYAVQEKLPVSDHAKKLYLNSSRKILSLPEATAEEAEGDRLLRSFNPCKNSLFVGLQGSGKGMLVSNAIRHLKRLNPSLGVYFVDPKASYREADYWLEICDVYERKNCEELDAQSTVDWVKENFTRFNRWHEQRGNSESLLILDEGWLISRKCEAVKSTIIKDKIISLDSLGNESGRHFWLMSQTPFMGALGIDLSVGATLKTYAIIHKSNIGTLRGWGRASAIAPLKPQDAEILLEKSECDRILYNGATSRWQPMPELPNYSGFNRDKREAVVPDGELDKLKAARKNFAGSDAEFLEEIGCPLEMRQRILEEMKNW